MFSIAVDVVRGIIGIRMRGTLTDAMRAELANELSIALEATPPVRSREWMLRVTAKPLAQYTPELAANVCKLVAQSNAARKAKSAPPPASRVVSRTPETPSAAARLVHFVTA